MSFTRVVETRAYDTYYDPVYTGPYNNTAATDARVVTMMSSANNVSGAARFKYFKRPIMPRVNAIPPHLLLAPTSKDDPMVPIEAEPEPTVKSVEVQTMYRESDAQTVPYTPDYIVPEGQDPEILMLQGLTYENGLPVGAKQIEMIEHARAKRALESNLLPFTDEACLGYRKKLMEMSEVRQFQIREAEIDSKRDERLLKLKHALEERDESNEFLASQRIESIRQAKMEEREKNLQKIRKQRVKVLRRLARHRNEANPVLSDHVKRDIINDYFDKGSTAYAPVQREGTDIKQRVNSYEASTRIAPINTMNDLINLETAIPRKHLMETQVRVPRNFSPVREMSSTAPAAMPGGGRVAKPRMTSTQLRAQHNTQRDIQVMHDLLQTRKIARTSGLLQDDEDKTTALAAKRLSASLSVHRAKARPTTPDFSSVDSPPSDSQANLRNSLVVLQRLIRGRAVQNSMLEGRFRRSELIAELRAADAYQAPEEEELEEERQLVRAARVRETTVDAVAGTVSSNVLSFLSAEQDRIDLFNKLKQNATDIKNKRQHLEAAEAGRRQRENMAMPQRRAITPRQDIPQPILISNFGSRPGSGQPPPQTPPVLLEMIQSLQGQTSDRASSLDSILENIESYPSLIESYQEAETDEQRAQLCRDLIYALESPREVPDAEYEVRTEDMVRLMCEKLQALV